MQLNSTSNGVTTFDGIDDNTKSKIWEAKTPDGLAREIPDGALLVMKLQYDGSNEISDDSEIIIAVAEPVDDFPRKIDKKSYRPFANKSISDQYDETKNNKMLIEIDGGGIRLPELNTLEIWVKSPSNGVDISNSTIEINDVEEFSM